MSAADGRLESAVVEIEAHVHASGWDRPPVLFALVRVGDFVRDEPALAAQLGVEPGNEDALTPIEQEALPEGALDDVLARIAWPPSVTGCVLAQEIVFAPPDAPPDGPRREARLVAGVLRDGPGFALLRLRAPDAGEDDLLTGPELAPNLAAALQATFEPD